MTITTYTDRELALQARIKELEAQIEASLKQEAVAVVGSHWNRGGGFDLHSFTSRPQAGTKLYAAPVIAPDVLKDAERYRHLTKSYDITLAILFGISYGNFTTDAEILNKINAAIDAAMGGAND